MGAHVENAGLILILNVCVCVCTQLGKHTFIRPTENNLCMLQPTTTQGTLPLQVATPVMPQRDVVMLVLLVTLLAAQLLLVSPTKGKAPRQVLTWIMLPEIPLKVRNQIYIA